MSADPLLTRRDDAVVRLQLNRPAALNSIGPELLDALDRALDEIATDSQTKVVVLTGNEHAFSAGADLKHLQRVLGDMAAYQGYLDRLNSVFSRLESLPVPTVAVVRGYALAGGLELMLCCDFALCADDARIGDQHANYDLMPGIGGVPRLIRRIGWQRAIYLLYSGRWLSGAEAAELGLVLKSVPAESLDHEVNVLCSEITPKSREVLQHVKRAALAGRDLPLAGAMDQEKLELIRYLTSSRSALEGIARFLATDRATQSP